MYEMDCYNPSANSANEGCAFPHQVCYGEVPHLKTFPCFSRG